MTRREHEDTYGDDRFGTPCIDRMITCTLVEEDDVLVKATIQGDEISTGRVYLIDGTRIDGWLTDEQLDGLYNQVKAQVSPAPKAREVHPLFEILCGALRPEGSK